MKLDLNFTENNKEFKLDFGQIQDLSDGGYERGYERGKADEQKITTSILDGTIEEYYNENVTTIKRHSFGECRNLKSVSLPNATRIGGYAFRVCSKLESVNIPSIKTLGDYNTATFMQCYALKKLDLHGCESIWQNGLINQCKAVKTLIFRGEKVCVLTGGSLGIVATCLIYVPDNLVEEYKVATNWTQYAEQIKPLSELPEEEK